MKILQFDSTFALLKWFVNREFRPGPKEPGNHSPIAAGCGMRILDTEEVWNTHKAIGRVIASQGARNAGIIMALFEQDVSYKDLGRRFRVSTRQLFRIRGRLLDRLTRDFEREGLISRRYEPPVYLQMDNS